MLEMIISLLEGITGLLDLLLNVLWLVQAVLAMISG